MYTGKCREGRLVVSCKPEAASAAQYWPLMSCKHQYAVDGH